MTFQENPLGLSGIDFVAFTSPDPEALHHLFLEFGFSRTARHARRNVHLYEQNGIVFLLDREPASFAERFASAHGPSVHAMGWRVRSAEGAAAVARTRGADVTMSDDLGAEGPIPAVTGIGGGRIYLTEGRSALSGFLPLERPDMVPSKGFLGIDHLTNNVAHGTMGSVKRFYEEVFGFREVRYFDIRGVRTGLSSFALRSPCGTFCIPINEAAEQKSQINEFIEQHRGPGIQHIAFTTHDILASLRALEGSAAIRFLDIDDTYYDDLWTRLPHVRENKAEIRARNVLVDGDAEGYLLQIFTQPVVGPLFVELIQRNNHQSFGEGNFGALFRSIERDQARRGVFATDAQR